MNNQSYEITVDTQKSINHSNIEFSQNNLNISELIFNITEDGKELPLKDTDEIIVYFKKPDKTVVFQDKEIELLDKSKGKVKVLLTTQTLVKAGDVEGEISIGRVDNGMKKRTSTYGFSFKVRSSLASNDSIESTNEFQMFDQLLELGKQDIPAIIDSKETAEQALKKSEENANQIGILSENTTTNTNKIAELNKKVGEGNAITLKTAAARNSNIVCIGDSITAGQGGTRNYPFFLDATLQGLNIKNVGVGGVKIAYHITNSAAYLNLNPRPNIAIVLIGTNDLNVPSVLNQMKTDYKELIAILTTNNITPVLCTLLPRTDNSATTSDLLKFNEFIREFARMMGFTLIDTYEVVANKDGSPKLGYLSADNLHPTTYGYQYIAEAIAKGLPLTYKNVEWNVPTTSNIILNPAFTTDANSDGRADNWSNFSSSGVTATYTLSDHPIEGKWQQISKTGGVDANSSTYLYQLITLPAGIVPGDTVLFSVDVETDEITVGDVEVAGQWLTSADAFISSITPLNRTGTQIRAKRFKIRQVIPASATKIKVLLTVYGNGTTVARFGRVLIKRIETI
ncbi:GDSL-type esterase/lipase family protein [Bacillus sp. OTC-L18]|uniref:GDSL-type esterase/lipase family protein n=1 Tax=Bacillus sp. OTC-L18 TaxID=3342792 RepID=UPI0035B8A86E